MLRIENLRVSYSTPSGRVGGVSGLSFTCGREKLGIVGESGSGKSTIGKAIMGLLPTNSQVEADVMRLGNRDLISQNAEDIRSLRGRRMAMIFQDPLLALNPTMTVGAQISESFRIHQGYSSKAAQKNGMEMLDSVHIEDPEQMWKAYPNALSGGMAQRAMIAMMLACEPDLLIADEPTSALDVISRRTVLQIIDGLVASRNMGLLLISHDLGLVEAFCDRILIIKNGKLIETIPAKHLYESNHAYTQELLNARPRLLTRSSHATSR